MNAHARTVKPKSSRTTRLTAALAHLLALACLVLLVRSQTAAAAGSLAEVPVSVICGGEYLLGAQDFRCKQMPCTSKGVNSFFNRYGDEMGRKLGIFCKNPGSATSALIVANRYFDICRETCESRSNEGTYASSDGAKHFKRECIQACGRSQDFMVAYIHGFKSGANGEVRAPSSSGKAKVDPSGQHAKKSVKRKNCEKQTPATLVEETK